MWAGFFDAKQLDLWLADVCAQARALLTKAEQAAANEDEAVRARVRLYSDGFRQTELWSALYYGEKRLNSPAGLQRYLEAAKAKKLSDGLRMLIEPPPAKQSGEISASEDFVAPVIGHDVNKLVSDFQESPDFSRPETACATWERACARMDTTAINQMSGAPRDPSQLANWYVREHRRDTEGMAIYLKAKIIAVQTWHDDLANVIAYVPFPPETKQSRV